MEPTVTLSLDRYEMLTTYEKAVKESLIVLDSKYSNIYTPNEAVRKLSLENRVLELQVSELQAMLDKEKMKRFLELSDVKKMGLLKLIKWQKSIFFTNFKK